MSPVSRVTLVAKTHFDFGFTDFAAAVERRYLEEFLPRAIRVAEGLRNKGDGYAWTTGSWLIWRALEVAGPSQRTELERAIGEGVLHWHALPFTFHAELCDASMFRFGLSLSQRLDRRFGRRTVAAKSTDVPGVSIATVPLLADAGVTFLHLGRNPCSRPPRVPPLFRWRCDGREVIVAYSHDYGGTVHAPDESAALVIAHTPDNVGPHDPDDWRKLVEHTRQTYRFAEVRAGRLDDIVPTLDACRDLLPVVESDMGDSWLHGGGSDPAKMSSYRAVARSLASLPPLDPTVERARLSLLRVPEHTWGLNHATTLTDHATSGEPAIDTEREDARRLAASWEEQRKYVDDAMQALPADLKQQVSRELADAGAGATLPRPQRLSPTALTLATADLAVTFCQQTGAVTSLVDRRSGRDFAGPEHPLGLLRYELYDASEHRAYAHGYVVGHHLPWRELALREYSRVALREDAPARTDCSATLGGIEQDAPDRMVMSLTFGNLPTAPSDVRVGVSLDGLNVRWHVAVINKLATRWPEAMWCDFGSPTGSFRPHVLGRVIDVGRVPAGGMGLHGVERGVYDPQADLWIESPDSPLVQIGRRRIFELFEPARADVASFNLFNNLWCTNFAAWSAGTFVFRFLLRLPQR